MTYFCETVRRRVVAGAALLLAVAGAAVGTRADPSRSPGSEGRRPRCGEATATDATGRNTGDENDQGQDGDAGNERSRRKYGGDRGSRSPYDLNWTYGRSHGDTRSPRGQEWEETQAFMQRFAPRRQGALEQMPEGATKESIKRFLFARFRSFQSLQRRDPAGYQQRLTQMQVEDDIFGLVSNWGGASEADIDRLRDALRVRVRRLVDLDLNERQRRVESLKIELAEQAELLEKDREHRDSLVERRVSRFADWAGKWAARRKELQSEKQPGTADEKPAKSESSDRRDSDGRAKRWEKKGD